MQLIYSFPQLEGAFRNSKYKVWFLKQSGKVIDGSKEAETNDDAWDQFIECLANHPYGTYTLVARTSDGANKNERPFTFVHASSEQRNNNASLSGLPQHHTAGNSDAMIRLIEKHSSEREALIEKHHSEREAWQREKATEKRAFDAEIAKEREKRAQIEDQLRDMKTDKKLDERMQQFAAKNKPRLPKKQGVNDKLIGLVERGVAIAGHHFGYAVPPPPSLNGVEDAEYEEETEETVTVGEFSPQQKTLLYSVLAFLGEYFQGLNPLTVINLMRMSMNTDEGKAARQGIIDNAKLFG